MPHGVFLHDYLGRFCGRGAVSDEISELPVAHAGDRYGHDPRDLIQITRNWFLAAGMLYEFGGAINHGEPRNWPAAA